MEKNRSSKILAIIALLIAVASLTVGFATFSSVLRITPSATVKTDPDQFSVVFADTVDDVNKTHTENNVTPTLYGEAATLFTATEATIDNSDLQEPKLENLSAVFTKPGQSAEYSLHVVNTGKFKAYLKSINYGTIGDTNKFITCTAIDPVNTTESYVNAACEGITVTVKIGNEEAAIGSKEFANHTLDIEASETLVVTIKYNDDAAVADGDFEVEFGNISLDYRSM